MKYRIPEQIETERLILRTFKESDWKDLYEYYSDEVCMKYTVGNALTDWETWRAMAIMVGHWELRDFGPYAVENRETAKVMGPVGLWYPLEWPEPEIKYGLARSYWGNGYAGEAVIAVREMAAEHVPEYHLISLIHPDNEASIKLVKSIGAEFEKTTSHRGEDGFHIYRHRK